MKAIINVNSGGQVIYNVGEDTTFEIIVTDDAGVPIDVTLDTVSIEAYVAGNRATVLATKALSGGTPLVGHMQAVLADDEATWSALGVGVTSPLFVKIVEAGGDILLSENQFTLRTI